MLAARLLMAVGGSGSFIIPPATLPSDWGFTEAPGQPGIDVADNPAETVEQYVPAPIELSNGDVWVYVKGQSRIYAWLSTDGGVTFSLENGGSPVIAPGSGGSWDDAFALEPMAIYDEGTDTIHLWYKGFDGANWAWGYATAPGSDPTEVTKDAGNPILTAADVSTDIGGGAVGDLAISDVIVIDGTVHFYGYCFHGGLYKLIQATGPDFSSPSGAEVILNSESGSFEVTSPSVFRMPGFGPALYVMFYTRGGASTAPPRGLRVGTSSDGETWDFSDTAYILEGSGSGWIEDGIYAASMLKETTSPYVSPIVDGSARWRLFVSGIEDGTANAGLHYMEPS